MGPPDELNEPNARRQASSESKRATQLETVSAIHDCPTEVWAGEGCEHWAGRGRGKDGRVG